MTVANGANTGIISKAITPKLATSKILVRCSLSLAGAINSYGYCRLFRQISGQTAVTTGVSDQASGSQINASFEVMTKNWTYQGYRESLHAFEFLDSPSTTSATTYTVAIGRYGGSGTANYHMNGTKDKNTLTLMEVSV